MPSLVWAGGQAGRTGHCENQRRLRGQCTKWSGDLYARYGTEQTWMKQKVVVLSELQRANTYTTWM